MHRVIINKRLQPLEQNVCDRFHYLLHIYTDYINNTKYIIFMLKASAHSFKRFYFAAFKIIFLSLYAPIYLGWTSCLISFAWDQSTRQERVESDKIQNEKFLPTAGLELTTLRLEV